MKRTISRGLFLFVLSTLVLPFMTVSCGGEKVMTVNGYQAAFGADMDPDASGKELEGSFIAILIFIAALIGFGLTISPPAGAGSVIASIVSVVGALLLFVYKLNVDRWVWREGRE